jgi:hypothetical protein
METLKSCPTGDHFHVIASDMNDIDNRVQISVGSDPEIALSQFLTTLPPDWEGEVSVNDDASLHPSEMPILQLWREPAKIDASN